MKLICTLPPRTNDTVTYTDAGVKPPKTIVFSRDPGSNELVADVPDDATVGKLLLTDNFAPALEEDYPRAEALMEAAKPKPKRRRVVDEDDDEDDDGAMVVNGGLPVEANTPPVPSKPSPQARMGRGASRRLSLGA